MDEQALLDVLHQLDADSRASVLRVASFLIVMQTHRLGRVPLRDVLREGLEYLVYRVRSVCHG